MANRLLLGNRSSGGYGLYISKPGKDVTSCGRQDLIFDSSTNMAATVHTVASVTISSGNSSGSTTWDALGYTPIALWTETSAASGGNVLGMGQNFSNSGLPDFIIRVGMPYVLTDLHTDGCTVQTTDGTNVSGNKFFRILVLRFEDPN